MTGKERGNSVFGVRPAIAVAVLAVLAVGVASSLAAVSTATASYGPFTPSLADDETYFAADVSNSDLLQQPGVTAVHGLYMDVIPQPTPAGLTDGNAGGDYDGMGQSLDALYGTAWLMTGDGTSWSEYNLGAGTGQGYDITGIQSIAAWQGAGFANQKYTVSVKYLGASDFTPLTTVDFQPFPADLIAGGSTKVNVTDSTGVLASGVVAIKFSFLDTIGSINGAGSVMREIDVFGTPTPEPTTMALLGLGGLAMLRRRR